jgi:septal ring factor EnvC (AmiA/AmiB activator)
VEDYVAVLAAPYDSTPTNQLYTRLPLLCYAGSKKLLQKLVLKLMMCKCLQSSLGQTDKYNQIQKKIEQLQAALTNDTTNDTNSVIRALW